MIELAIDGSFDLIDLSIFEDRELIYSLFLRCRATHSKILTHVFSSALTELSLKLEDIERFYCCIGCGKYTSLRVTLATIKGMLFERKEHIYSFALTDLIAAASEINGSFRAICYTSKNSCCFADYSKEDSNLNRLSEITKASIETAQETNLPIVTHPGINITRNLFKLNADYLTKTPLLELKPLY